MSGPSVVTIGNFDGLHAGHRHCVRRVVALAKEHGWTAAAVTFDPHPTQLVAPLRAPLLLTTPQQRAALMRSEGIQEVVILPFTKELSCLSPEEFVKTILVDRLNARMVLVGDNFRFGHRAAHRRRGARDRIAAKVDGSLQARGGNAVLNRRLCRGLSHGVIIRASIRVTTRAMIHEDAN